jgi:hypothetical protein
MPHRIPFRSGVRTIANGRAMSTVKAAANEKAGPQVTDRPLLFYRGEGCLFGCGRLALVLLHAAAARLDLDHLTLDAQRGRQHCRDIGTMPHIAARLFAARTATTGATILHRSLVLVRSDRSHFALDATRLTLAARIALSIVAAAPVTITRVTITRVTIARRVIARCLLAGSLVAARASVIALTPLGALVAGRALHLLVAVVGEVSVLTAIAVVAVELILVAVELVALAALLRVLFLEARARLGQHAEIVIGELKIIFGVHPVARQLRVASQILVFLKQLRGIATRAIVDAVALVGIAATLLALASTTTTATVVRLTIVDQRLCVLSLLNPPSVKQRSRMRVTPHAATILRIETAPAWLPDNQQRTCLDLGRRTFSTI